MTQDQPFERLQLGYELGPAPRRQVSVDPLLDRNQMPFRESLGLRRRAFAPKGIDESITRDHLAGVKQQERQKCALLSATKRRRVLVATGPRLAQGPEVHRPTKARRQGRFKVLARRTRHASPSTTEDASTRCAAQAMTSQEDETLMRGRLRVTATAVATVTALAATTAVFAAADERFPQGRFTSPLVAADFTRYSGSMDPNFPHPWIITLRGKRWHTNEQPSYGGPYLVRGNRVTFVIEYPTNAAGSRQTLTWTYSHKRLRFKIVSGVEGGDQAIYLAHPWRLLGP